MTKSNVNETRELNLDELEEVSGGDCYYDGKKYSNGAKIVHSDGTSQTCVGDSWQ